ncbi:hypothetical protein [Flavobacterium granuli]|uniref:Uncharacterized protein n=1 Tax=Flavobacterium granuli TaxID=280093 RepID=A0ABU1S0C9_9FLAO|nr:hypothetical protein [Flavobacterium granuli]MDR6844488.1 hypothetical protein [Flavobacterium granuli]
MKISEVPIGHKFNHGTKGEGIIIGKTKRTLTAKFDICTTKVTYRYSDAYFSVSDF